MKLFETTSADSTMRGTEEIERDLQVSNISMVSCNAIESPVSLDMTRKNIYFGCLQQVGLEKYPSLSLKCNTVVIEPNSSITVSCSLILTFTPHFFFFQEPPSEGEIVPGKVSKFNLADDPVVALLARLGEPLQSTPQFRPPVSRRPTNNEARSPGEVSLGQRPSLTPSTERFVIEQVQNDASEDAVFDEVREIRQRLSPGELGTSRQEKRHEDVLNNQQGSDSTLRISHLLGTNGQNSNPAILVGSHVDTSNVKKSPVKKDETETPNAAAAAISPRPAPRPRVINIAAPRVIQVGGRSPDREEGAPRGMQVGSRSPNKKEEGMEEVAGAAGGDKRQSLDVGGMTPVEDLPGDQEGENTVKRQPMPAGRNDSKLCLFFFFFFFF